MILLKFLWVKRDYSSESEGGSKKKHAWVMMEEQFKKTFVCVDQDKEEYWQILRRLWAIA